MGRVQTHYTYAELAEALGMPTHARLDSIDVDDATRYVAFVWRSGNFVEIDDDDGFEPPVWPVGVLKADAEHERSERQAAMIRQIFTDAANTIRSAVASSSASWMTVVDTDAITDYGKQRDQENGFTHVDEPTYDAAVCPACGGGLVCREMADVRVVAGYRAKIGATGMPTTYSASVLRCVDCGHRQPVTAGLEVV